MSNFLQDLENGVGNFVSNLQRSISPIINNLPKIALNNYQATSNTVNNVMPTIQKMFSSVHPSDIGKAFDSAISYVSKQPIINIQNPIPFSSQPNIKLPFQVPTIGETIPPLWQVPLRKVEQLRKTIQPTPYELMTGNGGLNFKTETPQGFIGHALFGNEPIQSFPNQIKETYQAGVNNGIPKPLAAIGAPLGVAAISALDVMPASGAKEDVARTVLTNTESRAIQASIIERLATIRNESGSASDWVSGVNKLVSDVIKNSQGDKNVLSGLRTGIAKELKGFVGDNGGHITDLKIKDLMRADPEMGTIINNLEDHISGIDNLLTQPAKRVSVPTQAVIKARVKDRLPITQQILTDAGREKMPFLTDDEGTLLGSLNGKPKPTVTKVGELTLKEAAQNARSAYFSTQQEIQQIGHNTAQIVNAGVNGINETRLFRNVIEHPERLDGTLTQVSNPEKFKEAVTTFRNWSDTLYKLYNESGGEKLGYLKNFYSHIVDLSTPELRQKFEDFIGNATNYKGWFSKSRYFKDIEELQKAGFTLKHPTAMADIQAYTNGLSKKSAANAFITEMKRTHPDHLIVLKNENIIARDAKGQAFIQVPHYGMEGTFVSPDLAAEMKPFFKSGLQDSQVVQVADKVNQISKFFQLSMGGFHILKTTQREIAADPLGGFIPTIYSAFKNFISPDSLIAFRKQAIEQGIIKYGSKINVTFGTSGDYLKTGESMASKMIEKNPMSAFQSRMFEGLIDTYKIKSVQKIMNKFDLNNPQELEEARKYGAQINDLFGGLNYTVLNRNKTVQQILRLGILAPDFNEGKLRQVALAFNVKDWSSPAIFARQTLIGEALVVGGSAEIMRKLVTGNFSPDFKSFVMNDLLDPSFPLPQAFNNPMNNNKNVAGMPSSDIGDMYKAFKDPMQFIQARGSAGLGTLAQLTSGKDYYGQDLNLLGMAQSKLPIPAVQLLKTVEQKQTLPTAILNTLGLRIHSDSNNDSSKYYLTLDEVNKSLNPQQQAVLKTLTLSSAQGGLTSSQKAQVLMKNGDWAISAYKKIQLASDPTNPLWSLSDRYIKGYLAYQSTTDTATKAKLRVEFPMIPQIQLAVSTNIADQINEMKRNSGNVDKNSIGYKLGVLTGNQPQDQLTPSTEDYQTTVNPMQKLSQEQVRIASLYTSLPSGSVARKALLASNPWLKTYWDENQKYYQANQIQSGSDGLNNYLASLGISPEMATTQSSGFYSSNPFKGIKKATLKKVSVPTFKHTKIKLPKTKIAKIKVIKPASFHLKTLKALKGNYQYA